MDMLVMASLWAGYCWIRRCDRVSQIFRVPSSEPEAKHWPEGWNLTVLTVLG